MRWRTANNNRRRKQPPRGGIRKSALRRVWINICADVRLIVQRAKEPVSYPIGDGIGFRSIRHPERTDR